MKKGNASTQSLLGVKCFTRNGIETCGHGEIVYFTIKPTNISVLSRSAVAEKIRHLMTLITAIPDLEIMCIDARENFDDNKLFLDERIDNETNPKIREILKKDKIFLDEIQVEMSTAREFIIAVRESGGTDEQSFATLARVEKCINDAGFDCKRAERDDVKRILARYFGIKTTDNAIGDTDGEKAAEKWVIED